MVYLCKRKWHLHKGGILEQDKMADKVPTMDEIKDDLWLSIEYIFGIKLTYQQKLLIKYIERNKHEGR